MHQFVSLFFLVLLISCANDQDHIYPPTYGAIKVHKVSRNGKMVLDTVYHTIGSFAFVNQRNDTVDESILKNKVSVASCFHSTFQTRVDTLLESALDSVNRVFGKTSDFYIISYTVDPVFDTPGVLKKYYENKQVVGDNWYFLTGQSPDSLYRFLRYNYLIVADRDTTGGESGGFIHSEQIVLVDRKQRIRGFYDGTKREHVGKLINDAKILLNEKP